MQSLVNKIFTVLFLVFATTFAQAAPWGTVHGYKFNDLNGNGVDNGEPRLGGITISIQGNGVQMSDITDAMGRYDFTNLPFQEYIVCEVLGINSPWTPTTPQCVEIELSPKDSSDMVIFGNKRKPEEDKGCTRTQGFWGSSKHGEALVKAFFPPPSTLALGTNGYTAAQLDSIFDVPAGGNAILILAHQLIAAKLNILNGASSAGILTTINNADTAIGAQIIPPIAGGVFIPPASPAGAIMVSLAADLDKYNKGETGIPHCD